MSIERFASWWEDMADVAERLMQPLMGVVATAASDDEHRLEEWGRPAYRSEE